MSISNSKKVPQNMNNKIPEIKNWIKELFVTNSWAKGVVIGMSGGRDCLAVAKLCIEALGKERVLGIIIPNGEMAEILDAIYQCKYLGINYSIVNLNLPFKNLKNEINTGLSSCKQKLNSKATIHMEPRLRMTILYAVSAATDYLVANTVNMTKLIIGSATKWGDNVGDFAPLYNLTKTEVIEIIESFMMPDFLITKYGEYDIKENTDAYDLAYRYKEIDYYVRYGICDDGRLKERVDSYYERNKHKHSATICYNPNLPTHLKIV